MSVDQIGLKEFESGFGGSIVREGDAGYDEAREVFNAMIDKRPAVIAACSSVEDVREAIRWGRGSGLPIAVRAGGHSVAGLSLNDGGLVIDVRGLNDVEVDAAAKTIRVGGGTVWGEFDAACKPHALAATGGRVTTTGVAGLTLGGGSGWMERKMGLACDNLIAVELMTADGRLMNATERENPELFWALHGGGGNFGIATSLTFRLSSIPAFTAGILLWPASAGLEVARAYRSIAEAAPDDFGGGFGFLTGPPEEFVPEHLQGTIVAGVIIGYAGPEAELRALIEPLLALKPDGAVVMELPYHDFNGMLDDPPGLQNWWTAEYHDGLPDAMLAEFCALAAPMKPSSSQVVLIPWGGAVGRNTDTPMANRHSTWVSHPFILWEDPAENAERIKFGKDLQAMLRTYSNGGTYLNFIGLEGQDRVVAAFGEDNYRRLAKVKAEFDPDNIFHGNQNIMPG
ncbi:MAG TPA: FAD-binding oxidoreductase [Actinomycetota bacterium]